MSKKNIDEVFQERFKDFGEVPDEKVWKSIEASLDQKKRKQRVIPFWWKLGGIAALLAVLFYVINPFNKDREDSVITDIENTEKQQVEENDRITEQEALDLDLSDTDSEAVVATQETEEEGRASTDVNQIKRKKASGQEKDTLEDKSQEVIEQESRITSVDPNKKKVLDTPDPKVSQKQVLDPTSKKNINTAVAINKNSTKEKVETEKENRHPQNTKLENIILKENEEEALTQADQADKLKDSIVQSQKKSIFDEIQEQQKEEMEAVTDNSSKWSVGPSVAPVFFDSFGEGSPIHSNFVGNTKSGKINFSYGLAVSYEVSEKLSIRSGVHKVDYGYDTNDISFSSSLTASTNEQIDNIDYSATARNLVVQNSTAARANEQVVSDVLSTANQAREGRMVQQFGYIEVPVELNYALVDKKVGVNLIGGMSSLFLVDNSVILEADGNATEMGEANNINNVNFSTNVGIGINYKLSPKMQVNLEPMFKYQLNTFSEAAGTFQPFSLGVYSGVSFKF